MALGSARRTVLVTGAAGFIGSHLVDRLLADRFELRTHREKREPPIYALVMARKDGALGPQMVRSTIDCEQWNAEKRPRIGAGSPSSVAPAARDQSVRC
jgi:uncharacterized protein (TIGR03435 family)